MKYLGPKIRMYNEPFLFNIELIREIKISNLMLESRLLLKIYFSQEAQDVIEKAIQLKRHLDEESENVLNGILY